MTLKKTKCDKSCLTNPKLDPELRGYLEALRKPGLEDPFDLRTPAEAWNPMP